MVSALEQTAAAVLCIAAEESLRNESIGWLRAKDDITEFHGRSDLAHQRQNRRLL